MQSWESNRRHFGFQAVRIWSSISVQFRFQQWDCIIDLDFDIISFYFRLKLIVSNLFLIKSLIEVKLKNWKESIKKSKYLIQRLKKFIYIKKNSIYFDFLNLVWSLFDLFWSISKYFGHVLIDFVMTIKNPDSNSSQIFDWNSRRLWIFF